MSDPASGSSSHGLMKPPSSSPPQHNYSNIQNSRVPPLTVSNGGSLTSSRTQSSNASPALAESPSLLPGPPNIPPPPIPTESSVRSRTPMEERLKAEEVKKSKLADVQDLIHLPPPLSEDLVLRTLQARFFNKNYFVSFSCHHQKDFL